MTVLLAAAMALSMLPCSAPCDSGLHWQAIFAFYFLFTPIEHFSGIVGIDPLIVAGAMMMVAITLGLAPIFYRGGR